MIRYLPNGQVDVATSPFSNEEVADLIDRLDAAIKDAERYRWMTENYGLDYDGPQAWKFYTIVPHRPITSDKREIDVAIDAAIAREKP